VRRGNDTIAATLAQPHDPLVAALVETISFLFGLAKNLPGDVIAYYIDALAADPEALRGSFEFYRALGATGAQNQERMARRLTLPVLPIGGAESVGEGMGGAAKVVADDVQTVVLRGAGHWIAEQTPNALLAVLTEFLAPYRSVAATLSTA
jgi:pimeloyl-ACP methyl ester carboxylesterase